MALKLDKTQRRTLRKALAEADRFGASPMEREALVEALGVEANYGNPDYGDRDSVGPLQERSHYGSRARRRNTTLATRRFLTEARALRKAGYEGDSGTLAQKVQRSGHPERYEQRDAEAEGLIRKYGKGGLKGKLGQTSAPTEAQPSMFDAGAPAAVQLEQRARDPIQSAGVAPPAFSAQAALPQGYQDAGGGGTPSPRPSLADMLVAPEGQDVDLGGPEQPAAPAAGGTNGASAPGGKRGRVKVDPMADRPGVETSSEAIDFAERIAGRSGHRVRIGTGTRHSRLTVNGNVSDHWDGNAVDIPASGKRLIELGQAALIEAGMPVRKARKQTGGLYNVGGAQIIFNTQEGGDHTDHLHARPPKKKRRRR